MRLDVFEYSRFALYLIGGLVFYFTEKRDKKGNIDYDALIAALISCVGFVFILQKPLAQGILCYGDVLGISENNSGCESSILFKSSE